MSQKANYFKLGLFVIGAIAAGVIVLLIIGSGRWFQKRVTIETWPAPLSEVARKEGAPGLQEIPGVGKAIAGKIIELVDRGTFDAWERLTSETPETVLDLLELPGVGPKTAATLHQKFKIASLDDLKKFIQGGGLEMVDGIGPRTAERIKVSLARR